MPNRMLSGEIARSESLSRVSPEAELTFIHLVSVVDDFGRFDGRPAILLTSLFPLRLATVSLERLTKWLDELEEEELIRRYTVDDRCYLELPRWAKYQRLRSSVSKWPAPDGDSRGRPQSCVYFVRAPDGNVKIGFTLSFEQRFASLRSETPELVTLGLLAGEGRATEKRLHRQFAHLRTSGEWFAPGSDLLDWIGQHVGSDGQCPPMPTNARATAGMPGQNGPVGVGVGVGDGDEEKNKNTEARRATAGLPGERPGPAPDDLTLAQWSRLETLLRDKRPWLLDERSVDLSPHCCVGWVRAQVDETLAYWRGRPDAKAKKTTRGWVDTVLNRIYAEDSQRWLMLRLEPPIADIVRSRALFTPLAPAALRGAA